MKTVLFITLGFFVAMACAFAPHLILPMVCVIGLLCWLIYAVVKSAVKDALREYDKEKAKTNGQK